jgi:hypothetical protein
MGQQKNKVIKRKRRQAYLQRKVAAQAAAVKAKTTPRPARAKSGGVAKAAPKAAAPAPAPHVEAPAAEHVPVASEEIPSGGDATEPSEVPAGSAE